MLLATGKPHKFNFDHCYWSHDSTKTLVTNKQVFEQVVVLTVLYIKLRTVRQVGTRVLQNAFKGDLSPASLWAV